MDGEKGEAIDSTGASMLLEFFPNRHYNMIPHTCITDGVFLFIGKGEFHFVISSIEGEGKSEACHIDETDKQTEEMLPKKLNNQICSKSLSCASSFTFFHFARLARARSAFTSTDC